MKIPAFLPYPFFLLLLLPALTLPAQGPDPGFRWPEGKRAALSLSFDDARLSNVDVGTGLLDRYGVKATFYVVPSGVRQRLEQWRAAVRSGHEIGNHTLVHPCSGNFAWSREKALENYNLASMRAELLQANREIETLLGVQPVSFAYSCGQTYVGRGRETQSYVPLIAELFDSGLVQPAAAGNDPLHVDPAQLQGIEMDGKNFEEQIKPILESALQNGNWVVLAGHEIGESGPQTTRVSMLEALITYVQQPGSGIWLAPVGEIADYVKKQKDLQMKTIANALSFAATFDQGFDAGFARGDGRMHTVRAQGDTRILVPGMHNATVSIAEGKGRYGNALDFSQKSRPPICYLVKDNLPFSREDWSGTISLWLSLDPEKDLAPGFTDPIQITDVDYNDAALWVDFSDQNPRDFRMGVYGDLAIWNPRNLDPGVNPAFLERLLTAKDRPFGTGIWTHVAISFAHLNTSKGSAEFYINGKFQGRREISEPFSWDLDKARAFLGLNYIGLMDEIAFFDRALGAEEIRQVYQIEGGLEALLSHME